MGMSILYNVNLQVCKYNIMNTCIENPLYGNVDLRYPTRLCLVNEQNAIINLKNDIVKNTQKPDDSKKISSDFSLENVESLQK
jgi:hypothetical protein